MSDSEMIVVAGDSGVYVGYAEGGTAALGADGRVVLHQSRHLRRYYVADHRGDGSVSDLATRGIDLASSSVSDVVVGAIVLVGVRRALPVSPSAMASFGVAP